MPIVDRVKTLLDRKPLRRLLASVVHQLAKRQGRGVRGIFHDDGIWIHRTTHGYFAYHQPFVRLDMSRLESAARTNFFWGYQPRAGDVIVDVGAGVGEEALTFARAVGGTGRVICIEAHPHTYQCLQKLVQYNRLGNVTTINAAITGPACAKVMIEDSSRYLANRIDGAGGISVPAATLDAIRERLGLERIHFLKMNIEGAERLAMRGMPETLQRTEVLCVCCHDFLAESGGDDDLRTRTIVRQTLEQRGLRVVKREQPELPPYLNDQLWGYNDTLARRAAG